MGLGIHTIEFWIVKTELFNCMSSESKKWLFFFLERIFTTELRNCWNWIVKVLLLKSKHQSGFPKGASVIEWNFIVAEHLNVKNMNIIIDTYNCKVDI